MPKGRAEIEAGTARNVASEVLKPISITFKKIDSLEQSIKSNRKAYQGYPGEKIYLASRSIKGKGKRTNGQSSPCLV
jgi:hypothetical protein